MEKCPACGSTAINHSLDGLICKDRQIVQHLARIYGMEAELADYAETVAKLRADLAACRERLGMWREVGDE